MNKIILVGGVYGSGKSTLGRSMEGECSVIDYDHIVGDIATDGIEKIASEMAFARQWSWQCGFIDALADSARKNPLTIGLGTFTTRERRDRYFDTLSEVAEVTGLYLMLPMKDTIAKIKKTRPDGMKLVNANTYIDFYRTHNRTLAEQNNDDLRLPYGMPPEYCAILQRSNYEHRPQEQRWTVLTRPVLPNDIDV